MEALRHEIAALTVEGGWVLWALVALAAGIAFALVSIWQSVRLAGAPVLSGREWRRILRGREPEPEALDRLRRGLGDAGPVRPERWEELEKALFSPPARRIAFAFVLSATAPLIGLLGTVSGMFTTFDGMATRSASAPIDAISRGVSEALITTQAGLIIGVPSFIACTLLQSRLDRLRIGFDRLNSTLCRPNNAVS